MDPTGIQISTCSDYEVPVHVQLYIDETQSEETYPLPNHDLLYAYRDPHGSLTPDPDSDSYDGSDNCLSSPATSYHSYDSDNSLEIDRFYNMDPFASASDSQINYGHSSLLASPAPSHYSVLSQPALDIFPRIDGDDLLHSQLTGPTAQDRTAPSFMHGPLSSPHLYTDTRYNFQQSHHFKEEPYSPADRRPTTLFPDSHLNHPFPSEIDNPKCTLDESLNDLIADPQSNDPTVVQNKLIQDLSFRVGAISTDPPAVKKLFGKGAKDRVCSPAGLKASENRRVKPAKFFCSFKDCHASFTRNAGLKSHYKSHLGVTDLECPFCGTRTATSLDRHKKRCKQNPDRETTSTSRKPRKKRADAGSSKP